MTLGISGCSWFSSDHPAPTYPLASGASTPAATGVVSTARDANGNTNVSITVHHLALPTRVSPDATTYVMWLVPIDGVPAPAEPGMPPDDGRPVNVGAIRLDANLDGTLRTSTPFTRFDVIVTPEATATAEKPTHAPVLRTRVDRGNAPS